MAEARTERIDPALLDLELRDEAAILALLLASQRRAVAALEPAREALAEAVVAAAKRLRGDRGRLALVGAGASGRIAVQDGAELWPTYGWPEERLLLGIAGGERALVASVEGVEDDAADAERAVAAAAIGADDVVVALAASGRSPWTCRWLECASARGALGIALANNAPTPLLALAAHPIHLDSGEEVLAGSTRMAAGTAQKAALNLFTTTLMVRLNRTYGNLMVDMAARNAKLDGRRLRLLGAVLPDLDGSAARTALAAADGWVKLAALLARGASPERARRLLARHQGSLRAALAALDAER